MFFQFFNLPGFILFDSRNTNILLHSVIGFLAALYQTNVLTSVYLLEVLLVVYAAAVFFLMRKVYCELPMEKPRELDHFGRVIRRK